MSSRAVSRSRRTLPLAAILALSVAVPALAWGQASASVVARANVVSARAPRVELAVARTATARPAVAHPAGTRAARRADGVELTTAVRIEGNVGYRLIVRARPGADSLAGSIAVRDATGAFRSLSGASGVEVARGSADAEAGAAARELVFRLPDGAAAGEIPVVVELVHDPVS